MAKIFISYAKTDKELVQPYVEELQKKSYEILWDESLVKTGEDMRELLMEGQKIADGTIVFITEASAASPNVMSELGLAYSYSTRTTDKKFFIPIVHGKAKLPYIISNQRHLRTEDTISSNIINIEKVINDHFSNNANPEESKKDEKNATSSFTALKQGDRGDDVKDLQNELKTTGFFNGIVDGIFGDATAAAVKNLQKTHGYEQTGIYDEVAKGALNFLVQDLLNKNITGNPNNTDDDDADLDPPDPTGTDASTGPSKPLSSWVLYRVNQQQLDNNAKKNGDQVEWNWMEIIPDMFTGANNSYNKSFVIPFIEEDQTVPTILIEERQLSSPQKIKSKGEKDYSIRLMCETSFPAKLPDILKLVPTIEEKNPLINQMVHLSEEEGTKIIQLITKGFIGNIRLNESSLSEIFTDSALAEIKDDLDFQSDVDALASVIAYKEVKPPLAVGLFGNWGSGKSFFMNKLQKKIADLAIDDKGVYCKEVVQINFNSWHYSDSNLWASLITKIFDDLEKYGKNETNKLNTLFQNLNSTQELLTSAKEQITRVGQEITATNKRQEMLNEEIRVNAEKLSGFSAWELVKEVMKDPEVSKDVKEVKKEFDFLKMNEYKEIDDNIRTLKTGSGQVMQSLELIYSFRVGKWKALVVALLVGLVAFLLIRYVDFFREKFEDVKILVIGMAAVLAQVVAFMKPALKKVNDAHKRLTSLKATMDVVEQNKKNEFNATREQIKTKLEGAQASQNELKLQLEQLESKKGQLQLEIDDIVSGKKIVRFIESRVSDQRYVNSLGIISWIRKDFEELDFLLKEQYNPARLKELERNKIENVFQIDRIILYIDDLDRCDVSIVVRVLEAIHLLLAFPLFVVVVGVDPRWMHNALSIKYKRFLGGGRGNTAVTPETAQQDKIKNTSIPDAIPEFHVNGALATSYDYLEKIFQIPFVLKPMDKKGKDNLIRSQLEKKEKALEKPQAEKTETEEKEPVTNAGLIREQIKEGNSEGDNKQEHQPDPGPNIETTKTAETSKPTETAKEEFLEITQAELEFMQAIGFLIGDSPRTIKRYINIYRIIRTHSSYEFLDNNELNHYCASMVLLAMITGLPNEAKSFFKYVNQAEDTISFNIFLNEYLISSKNRHPLLNSLYNGMANKEFKNLKNITLDKFKQNLDLVSRFSFRDLMHNSQQMQLAE